MSEILLENHFALDVIAGKAADALNNGGIIVLPTDTIPGIGCRADNRDAISKLFKIKDRPENLPIPVILANSDDVFDYAADVPAIFDKLASKFWPGQLTVILKSNGTIDKVVGGGKDTIGFRVPDYRLVRTIVRKTGFPMALTSANPHSVVPTGIHEKILLWWRDAADMIILGASVAVYPPSTVVDLTGKKARVIREGRLDINELCDLLACE